jgi:hypothetical protein
MSIQLGILFILASHADGFATIESINADMRMLSGADWSRKLRELARRAGPINIFSDGLVVRQSGGWLLTDAGRTFLASVEDAAPGNESAVAARGLRLVVSRNTPPVAERPGRHAQLRQSLARLVAVR